MSNLSRVFNKVDREVVAEVQRLHVGAQVWRFLRIALFAFVASLPVGTGHLGWSALASLGAGALETAFRQFWPAFPLQKATNVVTRAVRDQATAIATEAVNAQIAEAQDRQRQVMTVLEALGNQARNAAVTAGVPVPSAAPPEPQTAAASADPTAKPPAVSA